MLEDIVKTLESLPLADLLVLSAKVAELVEKKTTASEVKAGEAAADVAADVAEKEKFPDPENK